MMQECKLWRKIHLLHKCVDAPIGYMCINFTNFGRQQKTVCQTHQILKEIL